MRKKVAIIGTAGVPARYGGFETLAHHLVDQLNDEFDLHVYASTKNYQKNERVRTWNGATIHYLPFSANGITSVLYDILSILHAVFYADTLVILGVSGGVFIPFVKLFTRKKIIVNIDGLEWRRAKWSKLAKRFLKFSERLAVRFSHADITDNLAIKKYTATYYKKVSYLIAYGGDHVISVDLNAEDKEKYPFLKEPYAFKVARIEPENNVELILKSFSRTDYRLVIVGNWDSSEYGAKLKQEYGGFKNITILDPIYDQLELDKLRSNCKIYVHGHSAGGTNPSLVEAMYLGLPIFAYDVSFNRETTDQRAVYFSSEEELKELINNVELVDLPKVSNAMKELATARYRWDVIANEYRTVIRAFDYNYVKQKYKRRYTDLSYEKLLELGYAHLNDSQQIFDHIKN